MFLNPGILNRLMKQAYKTYLYMAREEEWLYVAGNYWEVSILEKFIPKRTKGDMIALAGELPETGQRRRMNKDEDQFETGFHTIVDTTPFKEHNTLEVTDLILLYGGTPQRILQNADTGELYLINNVFTSLVDESQVLVDDGEYAPGAPFFHPGNGVLWANNVCRLRANFRIDDRNEKIMNQLKGLDLMPEMPE